ncbi:hypothetical protein [Caenibacillus caldisaponilyticus]|uniref:hypothetical protein n=1 Tax=Caenibacillus caldisaponilyticus TaxID=1674942 RepID=UPI00098867BB|nr:hypothetical protein [Caenibacillus caldisaponilyticus]
MGGIDMILVPVITGLVKATHSLGIPKKYSPIMAIVYGILGGVFLFDTRRSFKGGVIWHRFRFIGRRLVFRNKEFPTKQQRQSILNF